MRRLRAVALCTVLCLPAVAGAQSAAPAPPPPPPVREGTAEASFVSTSGNTDTQALGLGADVVYRPSPWILKWKAAFVRQKSNGELSAQSLLFAMRAERPITARASAFGEYGYLRNTFSGVQQRHTISGGLSYLLVSDARQQLKADGGLGYTNERRATPPDISTALFLAGLAYKLKVSDTSELADDARYDALFDDAGNWRFGNVIALTTKLTTLLSLKVSNTLRVANVPPIGFDKTDTVTAFALVAKF